MSPPKRTKRKDPPLRPYHLPPKPAAKSADDDSSSRPLWKTLLKWTFRSFILVVFLGGCSVSGAALGMGYSLSRLPDVSVLQYYAPVETTEIYGPNKELLMKLHDEENRKIIPFKDIPRAMKEAVIAAEDSRFYEHPGLDIWGLARAVKANFDSGAAVQGGSTLTQQVAKNMFLTHERLLKRKLAEAWLSYQIEQRYSKDQILEFYLNQVYWGHNAYGVEAASQTYFGKSAKQLELHEAAMLAGMLTGPELYSPYRSLEQAKHRQHLTLNRMVQSHLITPVEAEMAKKQPIKLGGIKAGTMKYPYFTSYVLAVLKKNYGESQIMQGGLKIYTTINPKWQSEGEKALKEHINHFKRYNVEQGALVAIEPSTGFVRAIVGGKDYSESQFNRAWQAQRQPGSSFKPFVYLAAFARGFEPATIEVDEPIQYRFGGYFWKPKNYSGRFSGPMTLQRALETSSNIIAVKLGEKVGNGNVVSLSHRLGIRSPLKTVLSLPLGASEVTPLEMANAYSTIATGGLYHEPTPILRIEDRFGNVIEDNSHRYPRRVVSSDPTNTLIKVMKGVITRGTAPEARFGRPAAGKTGTTSNYRDAWFVGFTPQLCTAVWIGNDTPQRMYGSATGGTLAAPLWARFMKTAHKDLPYKDFPNAQGNLPLLAGKKQKTEEGTELASAFKPTYEQLNKQAATSHVEAVSDINPNDLSVPIEELVPVVIPSSGQGLTLNNSSASHSSSLTVPQNTPSKTQNNSSSVVIELPATTPQPQSKPRTQNKKAINELDNLIKELDNMSNNVGP